MSADLNVPFAFYSQSFDDPSYRPTPPPCCMHWGRDIVFTSQGINTILSTYLRSAWADAKREYDRNHSFGGILQNQVEKILQLVKPEKKIPRHQTEKNSQELKTPVFSEVLKICREALASSDQLVQLCLRDVILTECLYMHGMEVEDAEKCCEAILLELCGANLSNIQGLDLSHTYQFNSQHQQYALSLIERPRQLTNLNIENFYDGMPEIDHFKYSVETSMSMMPSTSGDSQPKRVMENRPTLIVSKTTPRGHCGNPDTKPLMEVLSHQTQLRSLRMGYNGISSREAIDSLELINLKSLNVLSFKGNPLSTEAVTALAEVLKEHPSIIHFDLADCPITTEGFEALGSLIECNTPLESIYLTRRPSDLSLLNTEIPYETGEKHSFRLELYAGLGSIATALSLNTHLRVVDLFGRLMTRRQLLEFNKSIRPEISNVESLGKAIGVGSPDQADVDLEKEVDAQYPVKLSAFLRQRQAERASATAATSSSV